MKHLIDRLIHPGRDDLDDVEASPDKLEEAEAWTARKRAQTEATKREFRRYELELELEYGGDMPGEQHKKKRNGRSQP